MVLLFYITNISVDLVHCEIFHAKDGKGGIELLNYTVYFGHIFPTDKVKRLSNHLYAKR